MPSQPRPAQTTKALVRACLALRPGPLGDPASATKAALGALARRWHHLQAEPDALDVELTKLVTSAAPALLALLVTAGDNPGRLGSEAAVARLGGVAPLPASSGRTDRHRRNRGGDRHANHALWRIALVGMHCHEPTKTYVQRRTQQGLSRLDILRCLIGGLSGARPAQESGRARGPGQGTAPMSCHQLARLSSAALAAPSP